LARVNGGLVAYGWSVAPEIDLREGMQAAFEAIRLDQRNPYAHFALAIVSVFAGELPFHGPTDYRNQVEA
jgi:hypothetical protein